MRNINSMTVRELREMLADYKDTAEDDLPVAVCYNYGDHHRTVALDPIDGVKVMAVIDEPYSQSGYGASELFDLDGVSEGDDEETMTAVVIGSHFVGGRQ